MSAPVSLTDDDVISGAAAWLLGFPDIVATLGRYPDGTPWLFQHTLWQVIEGSSATGALLSLAGGWAAANDYNRMSFPRISLEIFADPQRDAGHNVTAPGEAQRRAYNTFRIFDFHLHRPASDVAWWGNLRTIDCTRLTEPVSYPVPDGDGLIRLQVFYAVTVG